MVKEGDKLPSEQLYEGSTENKIDSAELFKNRKGILLGFQGAFTPVCSQKHLPGFIERMHDLKVKEHDYVVCVTVNDPFVTTAWAKNFNLPSNVRVISDPYAKFTKAIGMDKDFPGLGVRSKRYTFVVENNVIKKVFEEPDGEGGTISLAENVIKNI